jgi:hypothetical protein
MLNMTVTVTFISPTSLGSGAMGVGIIRAQERIAVGATTTAVTQTGESVVIGNGETTMIAVAYGTTPDAAALNNNTFPVTSAGMPIGPGSVGLPISPGPGYKINAKAIP